MIAIVVAHDKNGVIGKDNDLPWHLPDDLKHFRAITDGGTVLMGKNTYKSILKRLGRSLPNRRNIVVSEKLNTVAAGFELAKSLAEAVEASDATSPSNEIYIIGGARLYETAVKDDVVDQMYVTEVATEVIGGDVWFPVVNQADWLEISRKNHPRNEKNPYNYSFVVYLRNQK